ncbi:hypothetical protein KIN20_012505 [Parelaphostrongylus tenuis]|uniref:Uncharacterized protein n=1 Tax=Parelaphostrongylus tenuis TaxID=148309 RepID=A0AAD5QN75_PARTN|nr:hypothetical protein KIN20_012505 [Parelaphostrongylus tenuis]
MLMALAHCTVVLPSVEMARSSKSPDRVDNKFCTIAIMLRLGENSSTDFSTN